MNTLRLAIIVVLCNVSTAAAALIMPLGGETWFGGREYEIRWDFDQLESTVDIDLWDGINGNWSQIASGIPATSKSYRWRIDARFNGNRFRLMVKDHDRPTTYCMSASYFSIRTVNSPLPGTGRVESTDPIDIVPNPAAEHTQLSWFGEADEVSVWTLAGIRVASAAALTSGSLRLDLSGWEPGAYLVEVRAKNGSSLYGKLIVVK